MPKTNPPFEVEAVSDDELDAGPAIPFTNVPPPRSALPTSETALPEDAELAPPSVDITEEIAAPVVPAPTESAATSKRPNRPNGSGTRTYNNATAAVRANPPAKAAVQRTTVASGQLKPRPKPQAKRSNNLPLVAGGVILLLVVVGLVALVVTQSGKQSNAVITAPTPFASNPQFTATQANTSGMVFPTQQAGSTESAEYGQLPKCSNYAAKVDNETILCDVYLEYVKSKDDAYKRDFAYFDWNSPAGRRALEVLHADALDELIDQEVAVLEAPKEGVTAPKDQIDQQMAQARAQAGFSDDATWDASLKAKGTSLAEIRRYVEKAYISAEMNKRHGTANDKETWIQVAHILIAPDNKALADSIYQQLQNGGDFTALAKQYSIDPLTKDKDGVIGFLNPNRIEQQTSTILKSLKDGETAPPLGTRKGWEIIRVLKRELRPVEDQASLKEQGQADFQTWVRPLWKNYTIVKNITFQPTITPDMSKLPPTFTPDPAKGTPQGLTGLYGVPTPVQTQEP